MTKREIIEKINEFIEWIPDDGDFNFVSFTIRNDDLCFTIRNNDDLYKSYCTTLLNPKLTRQVIETLDKDGDCVDRSTEVRKIRDFKED